MCILILKLVLKVDSSFNFFFKIRYNINLTRIISILNYINKYKYKVSKFDIIRENKSLDNK